jgi:pyruvate kinase
MKKTKIISTIGPASRDLNILLKLIESGVNIFRLNFSHGLIKEHQESIDLINLASKKLKKPVAILGDLAGPKIRIGDLYQNEVKLINNQKFILTTKKCIGNEKKAFINYKNIVNEVQKGAMVLIDDGKIELRVEKIYKNYLICKVIVGGILKSKKGVNFPGTSLKIKSLTKKDLEYIKFAIKNDIDFLAVSFVKDEKDILFLKKILEKNNANIKVIAKIETQEAVNNFNEILKVADGIMIARGDLAVEIGAEKVPIIQKDIIKKCNNFFKPVIVATQILESMILNPFPTRAEANDIANAILDGADALMLSGETATGKFPIKAVETMSRISRHTESHFNSEEILKHEIGEFRSINDAVSYAVASVSYKIHSKLIIALTESGYTARIISRFRLKQPIIALTPNIKTYKFLLLSFGCYPYLIKNFKNFDEVIKKTKQILLKNNLVQKGDKIVICAGIPFGISGSTNLLIAEKI